MILLPTLSTDVQPFLACIVVHILEEWRLIFSSLGRKYFTAAHILDLTKVFIKLIPTHVFAIDWPTCKIHPVLPIHSATWHLLLTLFRLSIKLIFSVLGSKLSVTGTTIDTAMWLSSVIHMGRSHHLDKALLSHDNEFNLPRGRPQERVLHPATSLRPCPLMHTVLTDRSLFLYSEQVRP